MTQEDYNLDYFIQKLIEGHEYVISHKNTLDLCDRVIEIFMQESNVISLQSPIVVVGDVHGQFFDVLQLIKKGGDLPKTQYLFIGDYVDRGYHSIETIELLFCYKLKYPSRIHLLRGNHESRQITQQYGFYDEIGRKYGNNSLWKTFNRVFDFLPVGATIDGNIFCVHGGLSPQLQSIDKIRTLDRVQEIPYEGPLADLMWSDPDDIDGWAHNARGAGYLFGEGPVQAFNEINGTKLVIRAHQLVQEGYQYKFNNSLATLWSAPNYCYRMGNQATILVVEKDKENEFRYFESDKQNSKLNNEIKKQIPYFM